MRQLTLFAQFSQHYSKRNFLPYASFVDDDVRYGEVALASLYYSGQDALAFTGSVHHADKLTSGGYSNMKCPKCESENTQRLEVAFHGGTQNISTTSNSAGVGIGSGGRIGFGGGVTKTSGQSQSILAQQASPPAKKSYKYPVIGISLGLFSGLPSLSGGTVGAILTGLAIISIWCGISGYILYSRFQFNSQEWPKLYQHWSESWLCHKCGGIYHQAT